MPTSVIEITPELENRICKLFKETKSTVKMQEILGIDRDILSKIVNKYNLRNILSLEDELKLINEYLNLRNMIDVGKMFGVDRQRVKKVLDKHNIVIDEKLSQIRHYSEDINPKTEDKIINLYKEYKDVGIVRNEIGIKISANMVYRILKKHNFIGRKLTPEQENELIQEYLEERIVDNLIIKYGVGRKKILNIFKKNNIKIDRTLSKTDFPLRNPDIFKKIDNEFVAYYLGFFYADGCLSKNNATIKIRDKDILEQFAKELFIDRKVWVYEDDGKPMYTLRISNKHISQDLRNIGLEERKSLTAKFPEQLVNSPFLWDFIRGYFDGDGCISNVRPANSGPRYNVSICVSEYFGNTLKDIFTSAGIVSQLYRHRENKIHILYINQQHSVRVFCDLIYRDKPQFYLERKKIIFDKFIKDNPNPQKRKYSSRYKGIVRDIRCKSRWKAFFRDRITKKQILIGRYDSEEDAHTARQKYLLERRISQDIRYGQT